MSHVVAEAVREVGAVEAVGAGEGQNPDSAFTLEQLVQFDYTIPYKIFFS